MTYMADYMLRRYHARRAEAVARLGGKCRNCGTTEHLEIDHIDPATKSFDLGTLWSVAKARYDAELEKCQLLCHGCHAAKSASEQSVGHGEGLTGKRNCRCKLCGPLKNRYNREFKARRRAQATKAVAS